MTTRTVRGDRGITVLGLMLAAFLVILSLLPLSGILRSGARTARATRARLLAAGRGLAVLDHYATFPELAEAFDGTNDLIEKAATVPPLAVLSPEEMKALRALTPRIHLEYRNPVPTAPAGAKVVGLALLRLRVSWKDRGEHRTFHAERLVKPR